MLRNIFLVFMILLALAVAAVAMLNNEIVTLNYLFGQVNLTLLALILYSVLAGILLMLFFNIYRSIQNYIKAEGERGLKNELQKRIKTLEGQKHRLENELAQLKKEREIAAAKAHADLENEKNHLEEELNKQNRERDNIAAKEQSVLEAEKRKLEEDLKKHEKERENLEAKLKNGTPQKKGFFDFLKR